MNKLFVISDIHGFYRITKNSLNSNGYEEYNPNHGLIVLGDFVDRGLESKEIFEWLYKGKRIVVIKGNHEDILTSFLDLKQNFNRSNYNYGLRETITSFCGEDDFITYSENEYDKGIFTGWADCFNKYREIVATKINNDYPYLLKWLMSLPYYYETNNYIFTHAAIDTDIVDWHLSDFKNEVWDSGDFILKQCNNIGNKKIVVGHFATDELRRIHGIDLGNIGTNDTLIYENKIFIDSCVIESKKLNVLIIEEEV